MKRFVVTLIGAGLAFLATTGARAESFTIQRAFPAGTLFTHTDAGGNAVDFNITSVTTVSPVATADPPGTSLTLVNYTVTAANPATTGQVNFADTFALDVTWTSTTQPGNPTAVTHYNGTINGWASGSQDNLVVNLTPVSPSDMSFMVGTIPYELSNFQKTLPPIINDTANPGAISATVNAIPEPGSMALLAMGALPILGLARRRK